MALAPTPTRREKRLPCRLGEVALASLVANVLKRTTTRAHVGNMASWRRPGWHMEVWGPRAGALDLAMHEGIVATPCGDERGSETSLLGLLLRSHRGLFEMRISHIE
jgi:hypothetical protein